MDPAADAGPTLSLFIEAWELFQDPVLAGVLAGATVGFLGVYVVLRRMVFLSAALSNAAGFGVVFAFWLQLQLGQAFHGPHHGGEGSILTSPTVWATLMTLMAAGLLMTDAAGRRRESLLGLAYLVGAAGALALGTRIVQEVHDVHEILFGSAVAVVREDLWQLVFVAVVCLGLHVWWLRGFLQASFDRDGARVRGLPVRLLDAALLLTLALAISVSTRVLGALPVFAFSVLPAMAAVRLAPNVPWALATATVIGGACGFLGYLLAFLDELPVGPSQTLVAALVVVAVELFMLLKHRRAA
jgi:zinc transport system permease protein